MTTSETEQQRHPHVGSTFRTTTTSSRSSSNPAIQTSIPVSSISPISSCSLAAIATTSSSNNQAAKQPLGLLSTSSSCLPFSSSSHCLPPTDSDTVTGTHAESRADATTATVLALEAVTAFLEDLHFSDIADALRLKARKMEAGSMDTADGMLTDRSISENHLCSPSHCCDVPVSIDLPMTNHEASTQRLVHSLLTASRDSGLSSVTDEAMLLEGKDPSREWSNDAAEKSVVCLLKQILELDEYLPRHQIKEITQRLRSTSSPMSVFSWIKGQPGYPRYKAPPARPSGRANEPPPLSRGGGSFSPCSSCPSPGSSPQTAPGKSPDMMSRTSSGSRVNLSLANLPRSEEYRPRIPGSKEEDFFDTSDQYRDDDDPGYRMFDLWETDLIEEIQARERNDLDAMRYPYFAAFVSRPLTPRKVRCPENQGQLVQPHHSESIASQLSSVTTTTGRSFVQAMTSTGPKSMDNGSSLQLTVSSISSNGTPSGPACTTTPGRRQSSNSSRSSTYVLNSTPLRQRSSTQGSPLSRSGFDATLNEAGTSVSSPSSMASLLSTNQRCSSPTFGISSPHRMPTTMMDEDDELSGAASVITGDNGVAPSIAESTIEIMVNSAAAQAEKKILHHIVRGPVIPPLSPSLSLSSLLSQSDRPATSRSTTLQPNSRTSPTLRASPKSPVFGTDEVGDSEDAAPSQTLAVTVDNSMDDTISHSVTKPVKVPKQKKNIVAHSPGSASELTLCSSKTSVEPETHLIVQATPIPSCSSSTFHSSGNPGLDQRRQSAVDDRSSSFSEEERRWKVQYCDGNCEAHRQKKAQEKLATSQTTLYPESGDPEFPIRDDGNKLIDCFNLKVIFERNKTGFEEYKDFQVKLGAVIAGRYVIESQLGQAAFSKALKCFDRKLKQHVCMKVIRNEKDYVDQSIDEIKLLRYINCNGDVDLVHCLRLYEFFYYREHLIIVTELLKENLYEFSRKYRERHNRNYFTIGRIQRVCAQVLVALQYIHSLRLIHSDLKPENILMKNPETCEVKVIDFGSSCFEDDLLSLYVQSRSYRAPEVLLGLPYDQKIDIWSLGCILAELWTGYVLFQNDSVAALLARIVGIIGLLPYYMVCKGQTVSDNFTLDGQIFKVKVDERACPRGGKRIRILLPKPSSLKQRMRTNDTVFIDFLNQLLKIDPSERLSATEALQHPFLQPERYSDGL